MSQEDHEADNYTGLRPRRYPLRLLAHKYNTASDSQSEADEEGEAPHSVLFARELNFHKQTKEQLMRLAMGKYDNPYKYAPPYEMTRSWIRAAEAYEKPDGVSAQGIAMEAVCGVVNAYRDAKIQALLTRSVLDVLDDAILREIAAIGPGYDQAAQGGAV